MKILVTSDLSENSERAFPWAAELAKKFDAKVVAFAVVEDPAQVALVTVMDQPVLYGPDIQKEIMERIEKDLADMSLRNLAEIDYECVVNEGGPAHNTILEFAKSNDVDLIIMATQGRTGVKNWILGSVTEKVSRQAHCPVLLVPRKEGG